jgi:pimeloyl-ACP methyl ester carboxylesterase
MRTRLLVLLPLLAAACATPQLAALQEPGPDAERVVLVHGLLRSSRAMEPLAETLRQAGYRVCNVDYPSTEGAPELLVADLDHEVRDRCGFREGPVDFVTHSLGGILLRAYAAARPALEFGRVVMLAPPNRGSEWVDALGKTWLFRMLLGPTAERLGTAPDSLPNTLGPAPFEVGVIAGTRNAVPFSANVMPEPNDGTVAVDRTTLDGMTDFLTVPETHISIRRAPAVANQVLHFLRHGSFVHEGPTT